MKIHIGVIGCGKISQVRHIPEYLDNPNVELIGLYDINTKRTEELANKYNCRAYSSYQELLADEKIDAVSVCVANIAHAEIAIAALKAGKHVLCEKPMAVTLDECEEMVKVSRETGKLLMIGQNQRLPKAHMKAKELIANGTIGKVISFRTTFGHGGPESWSVDPGKDVWFFDSSKAVMGAMADLGIHKTDLIQYLTGQTIIKVQAFLGTLDKRNSKGELIGVDDNAICIYQLSGGAIGTMTASWTYYAAEDNSTVIYGDKGMIRIYDNPVFPLEVSLRSGEKIHYELEAIQTNDNQTKSGVIDMFIDRLMDNNAPYISAESVLPAMKAVFAAIESSKTGKAIEIKGENL